MDKKIILILVFFLLFFLIGCNKNEKYKEHIDYFDLIKNKIENNETIVKIEKFKLGRLPKDIKKKQIKKVYKINNSKILFAVVNVESVESSFNGVLSSVNKGKSWQKFFIVPKNLTIKFTSGIFIVNDIFIKENKLFLELKHKESGTLITYYTVHGGKTWHRF